jgi:hypothetical protein
MSGCFPQVLPAGVSPKDGETGNTGRVSPSFPTHPSSRKHPAAVFPETPEDWPARAFRRYLEQSAGGMWQLLDAQGHGLPVTRS